ncbi:MAG: putative manganese-dependent inorganic diphosphatase [Cellulosilyticum sp.]|nr:putative manganese-dependent inorganic diphosphatase [Cellulosilyticum sp.]
MDKKIYVFGHKNPDSDSICASISYAHLKRALGNTNVEAVCLGKISKETQFALDYFGVKPPREIKNIKPQVSDLNFYPIPSVYVVDSVKKAWDVMTENGRQMIPVLYHDHKLAGVISISDIAKTYIGLTDGSVLRNNRTPFINIPSVLEGKVISGSYAHAYVRGDVHTTASLSDDTKLTSDDIIITGANADRIEKALRCGAGCVIITDQDMHNISIQVPENSDVAVVCTPFSFFKTIKMISQSISVKNILKKDNITFFEADDYLDEVKQTMLNTSYRHFPIMDHDGLVKGLISKRHLLDIQKKKVILVDHNERAQSADGIEQAEILEIIDHHRIANIDTGNPVFLRAEPVGCTNTIIAKMFEEKNIMPPRQIAGLMLSAILSDTLIFKSPTCTPDDIKMAERLAEIAEVDLYAYGAEMLAAGTSLEGTTPAELLNIDRKPFTIGKYNISVAQINTGDFKSIFKIKDDILAEMNRLEKTENLDLCLLMVTDIVVGGTELIVTGKERHLAESLFGLNPTDDSIFLQDVFSRKKQIVPKLMSLA